MDGGEQAVGSRRKKLSHPPRFARHLIPPAGEGVTQRVTDEGFFYSLLPLTLFHLVRIAILIHLRRGRH